MQKWSTVRLKCQQQWLLKLDIRVSYFTTGCRIGSPVSFNNANLSGIAQRVDPTNDTTSGIGIGIVR